MVIEKPSPNEEDFELDLSHEHLEPMLQTNLDRFVLFPIEHSDIWEMYKQEQANAPKEGEAADATKEEKAEEGSVEGEVVEEEKAEEKTEEDKK